MEEAPAPSRSCAVCGEVMDDAEVSRCPKCHSRYIRGGVQTQSRGGGLSVLPAPTPPPRREEKPWLRQSWNVADGPAVLGVLGLIAIIIAGSFVTAAQPELAIVSALLGIASMIIGFRLARRLDPGARLRSTLCRRCSYPIPPDHHGRCPECGCLVNELPAEQRFCPKCRRTLRGFLGDACPECGEDVRAICEGRPL